MAGLGDRIRSFLGGVPDRQAAQPFSEQGVSGYEMTGGVIVSHETNVQLIGQNRWRTAADILANISIVAASLRYSLNLLAQPSWKADPANDTAEAKAMAEFVEAVLDDIDTAWPRIVRRSAVYRYHGFHLNEWVAKKRDDGKIGIQSIEARPAHTIERWDVDLNGGVIGVWQRDPQTGREIYLPRTKLIYLVDDALTDRPDGLGLFRHLAEPVNRLKTYLKLEGIGFQRDLTGIPIGRAPLHKLNKMVEEKKITAKQRDQMLEGIKNFTRLETKNEKTGLIVDSMTYRGKTEQGEQISQVSEWGIDLLTGEQGSIEALGKAIKRLEFEMALIMGTSSLLTGREGEGSRALSEDQSRNLYLTSNSTLDDMAEGMQRDVVDKLWAMNGLSDDLKPRLTHEDVTPQDAEKMARTLNEMASAGAVLDPNDPAINELRSLMGLSPQEEIDMDTYFALSGKPDPNAPPPPAPAPGPGGPGGPAPAPKPQPKPKEK